MRGDPLGMDYVEPGDPRWAELMRRRAEQQASEAAVELPSWPVYAPNLTGQPCWLGGIGRRNGQLVAVGFSAGGRRIDHSRCGPIAP